jgi:dipeptidyl aminopeptidase/acylaminoacyl peptidase
VVDELHGHPAGVYAFAVGGGAIVYAATTPANPCTVRVRDARGDRLAFNLNEWVARKDLAVPVEGRVERPDGVSVQYWLMEPAQRDPVQTCPLVLEIHGGPNAMWGPGERSMWLEFQLLCSWGYAVVYANPRGSAGYGYDFERASFQNLAEGPAGDVLAVVDHALINEWIDPERLVITGGSYGGYLTAWIIAHDHRFKAAVAQRGVYDLATLFGEGAAWRLVEWWMGGWPWETRLERIFKRESPFTDVHRIRTPLLIMHGDRDRRTGFVQSEMLYRALKQLERPVEYVRYPGADHSLSRRGDPVQRMDRLNRIIDFFERHIDNPRSAPRAGAG